MINPSQVHVPFAYLTSKRTSLHLQPYCWLSWPCKFKAGNAVHLVGSKYIVVSSASKTRDALLGLCFVYTIDHNLIRHPPSAEHFPFWICEVNAISCNSHL